MAEFTTVPLSKSTRDRLRSFGVKGETYDSIMKRLMESVEYEEFMERQYRRLGERERFVRLEDI